MPDAKYGRSEVAMVSSHSCGTCHGLQTSDGIERSDGRTVSSSKASRIASNDVQRKSAMCDPRSDSLELAQQLVVVAASAAEAGIQQGGTVSKREEDWASFVAGASQDYYPSVGDLQKTLP